MTKKQEGGNNKNKGSQVIPNQTNQTRREKGVGGTNPLGLTQQDASPTKPPKRGGK